MEAGSASAPLLKASKVSRRFGSILALDAVDFELRRGEIMALLGEKTKYLPHLDLLRGGPVNTPQAIHAPEIEQLFQVHRRREPAGGPGPLERDRRSGLLADAGTLRRLRGRRGGNRWLRGGPHRNL